VPHFYTAGTEIIPTADTSYTDLSFDVKCSNLDGTQRLLNILIVNHSYNFGDSLPTTKVDFIRISQKDVILWKSGLIDVSNLTENQTFSVRIISLSEKNWTFIYSNAEQTINFNKEKKVGDIFFSIGNAISPSNPSLGLVIFVIFIGLVIFVIWYKDFGKKINEWKRTRKVKKLQKEQEEMRWKNMRQ
jgi:hypothetical protein